MNFLFDLDETLVRGDIIETVSKEMLLEKLTDRIYTGADLIDFNLTGIPDSIKERVLKAFCDPKYVLIKEPISEAYCLLCALVRNKHKVGILTSRPSNLKHITKQKIKRDFPGIVFELGINFANEQTSIELGESRPNKIKYIKLIKPDFYFDDSIEYCNQAIESNIENVYLISNKFTGWNTNRKNLNKRVKVIKNVACIDIWSIYGN